MSSKPVVSHSGIDLRDFWRASKIWLRSPHVVNRRILTTAKLLLVQSNLAIESECASQWVERLARVVEIHRNHSAPRETDILQALNLEEFTNVSASFDLDDRIHKELYYVHLQKLLPRNPEKFSQTLELAVIDQPNRRIRFFSNSIDKSKQSLGLEYLYGLEYDLATRTVSLHIGGERNVDNNPSVKWLREQFFPRFVKWTDGENLSNGLTSGSLNLISVEKYAILYNELKKKYGTEMVKVWPENTDPAKFVYEDVAIATYLLLLWEMDREVNNLVEKQSFVDLGCGNGLLVHILASEGHPGIGIDLRRRNIWDLYPKSTCLEVRTIVPSASSLFPETDWLIGNHSDELTPWIPVIAARSSYRCQFFLLPCCAYEFDGRKYQRNSAAKSQYFEYMNYMKRVCEECGFKTDLDKLRIPSTKRICLVGRERTYSMESKDLQENAIRLLIGARSAKEESKMLDNTDECDCSLWSASFKPRETVERVRNCTKVDRSLITDIVNLVAEHLLRKVRMIDVEVSEEKWNAGGQIELSQVAGLLPLEMLKALKSECGGLQTLLKNNSDIFKVMEGIVQFRVPGTTADATRKKKRQKNSQLTRQTKPCWFYHNHPNKCPLDNETCNYKH